MYFPRELDFSTLLPEMLGFRSLGIAMSADIEMTFSRGRPDQGVEDMFAALVFANKVASVGTLIHMLVGMAIQSMVLEEFDQHANRVSLNGGKRLNEFGVYMLSQPNPAHLSLSAEIQAVLRSLDGALQEDLTFLELFDVEDLSGIAELSDGQKQQVFNDVRTSYELYMGEIIEIFDSPEPEWIKKAKDVFDVHVPTEKYAAAVFNAFTPPFDRILLVELRRRTHFRLLSVYGAISEFYWSNGYLPGSLSQLEDRVQIIDPLNGTPFTYERRDKSFVLFSEGNEDVGRLDLSGLHRG